MRKNLLLKSATVALSLVLLGGCASTSQLKALQAQVDANTQAISQAQASADSANRKADAAMQKADAAMVSAEQANMRADRMLERSYSK